MSKSYVTCRKCQSECVVDGEFPKHFAWCDLCVNYADYDMSDYEAEFMSDMIDEAEHRIEAERDYGDD